MKAIEVVNKELILGDIEKPEPKENEVLIKVMAAGLNRADIAQKNGLYPPPPGASDILGLECSGVITEVGKEVTSRKPGDEVIALLAGGGYAEYVTCPEHLAIRKPIELDWAESASIPEVYATCWLNLFIEAQMREGDKVVFHAGASGIGTAGIQLAKAFGCKSFITAGTKKKVDFCLKLGSSEGEIRSKSIFEKIKNWAPDGVDIILDPIGGEYFENNLSILGLEGRLIIIGLMGGASANINLGRLMMKRHKVIGSTIRARDLATKSKVMSDLENKVLPLFKKKQLKPIVHEVLAFSECQKAHRIMEANENIGKIILDLN